MSKQPSQDWIDDSRKWWGGRVLNGTYAHWCPEWDDLPIDETCGELVACSCYDEPAFHDAQKEMQQEIDRRNEEFGFDL